MKPILICAVALALCGCDVKQQEPAKGTRWKEPPRKESNEPMAVSGIAELPPITVKLKNELLAALNMTDKVEELCSRDCSCREFVAALAPAEAAAVKLQNRLPADDPRRALLVNTFEAYQDTAQEMRRRGGGEDRVQRLSGEFLAKLRMAQVRKHLLSQVLDEHMTASAKFGYYMWRDEPAKAQAELDKAKEAEKQKSDEIERLKKAEEAKQQAEVAQRRLAEKQRKETEADHRLLAWHLQQASNGSASAQCSLGVRYLTGKGVEKDEALGCQWLEKSAAQNNVEAKAALAKLTNTPASLAKLQVEASTTQSWNP